MPVTRVHGLSIGYIALDDDLRAGAYVHVALKDHALDAVDVVPPRLGHDGGPHLPAVAEHDRVHARGIAPAGQGDAPSENARDSVRGQLQKVGDDGRERPHVVGGAARMCARHASATSGGAPATYSDAFQNCCSGAPGSVATSEENTPSQSRLSAW